MNAHEYAIFWEWLDWHMPTHKTGERFTVSHVLVWCELGEDRRGDVEYCLDRCVKDGTMRKVGLDYFWVDN